MAVRVPGQRAPQSSPLMTFWKKRRQDDIRFRWPISKTCKNGKHGDLYPIWFYFERLRCFPKCIDWALLCPKWRHILPMLNWWELLKAHMWRRRRSASAPHPNWKKQSYSRRGGVALTQRVGRPPFSTVGETLGSQMPGSETKYHKWKK